MAIAVTCPGCKARFAVDDKFAGKTGPCPKCKTSIKIPEKVEEVKIHAPEPVGTKDSKGAPVIKPIKRTDVKFTPAMIATLVGSILAVLVGAITLRFMYPEKIPEKAAAAAASAPPASAASSSIAARRPKPPTPIREVPVLFLALGAIALAPALCWSGYSFLRDDELAPMMGKELWTRVSICSAAYVLIWGIYFGLRMTPLLAFEGAGPEPISMLYIVPPMVLVGGAAGWGCFNLQFSTGLVHYGFYLFVTVILRLIIGLGPL